MRSTACLCRYPTGGCTAPHGPERNAVLVEIDGREVRSEGDLHRLLAHALDFGPHHGSNLDALWDRLSRDVPRPVRVVWTHWRVSRRNLGAQQFEKICDLLRAVQAEDRKSGRQERFEFELSSGAPDALAGDRRRRGQALRRVLFFLACVAVGVALLMLLSAGNGAGRWFGVTFCALLAVGGAVGGRWGRGPVARGVRAPHLARGALASLPLCVLAGVLIWWRPSVGTGLPIVPFLICMTLGLLLMVPVGLMGDDDTPTPSGRCRRSAEC
ncbi:MULTISPECIES: barstar family protein [unclassified Micromonospora]|uniref:barstar family protein n=1 Tax=unclassified Micromonospora TaxID=2617518 RepID=UPI00340A1A3A